MSVCLQYQAVYSSRAQVKSALFHQFVAGFFIVLALVSRIWLHIENTRLGYAMAYEQQRHIDLDMQKSELSLEKSVLLRSDRVRQIAEAKLGLENASSEQAIRISY